MNIYISELFPNPAGKDANNEWIELCNNGSQLQSLTGWGLKDASVKSFTIQNISVAPRSCVVFGNIETKLSLNNDKETISLFDTSGVLQDSVSYNTAVKDNYALARVGSSDSLQLTTTPTKGDIQNVITAPEARTTKNKITTTIPTTVDVGTQTEASGQIQTLSSGINIWQVIFIGICVAGVLAIIFTKVAMDMRNKKGELTNL